MRKSNHYRATLFISCILLFSVFSELMAQNVAQGAYYTVSPTPKHNTGNGATDKILTDGITGEKYTQANTLGWAARGRITFAITLPNKNTEVGDINFHTFSKTSSNAHYPKTIYAFLSNDNIHFTYAGKTPDEESVPASENMENKMLSIKNINKKAKYVTLIAVTNGRYMQCDEIQVMKSTTPSGALTGNITDIYNKVIELEKLDFDNRYAINMVTELEYNDFVIEDPNQPQDENLLERLKIYHAKKLSDLYPETFVVAEEVNPWTDIQELRHPQNNLSKIESAFYTGKSNTSYGAFVLTNVDTVVQNFNIKLQGANPTYSNINFFLAKNVFSATDKKTADALRPITNQFQIDPGVSVMIFYKILGVQKGTETVNYVIQNNKRNISLEITTEVSKKLDSDIKLNGNVWAYMNRALFKNKQKQVAEDLRDHGVNVAVIPYTAFTAKNSFSQLRSYLKNLKDADYFIFRLTFEGKGLSTFIANNRKSKTKPLSKEWIQDFIAWYDAIKNVVIEEIGPDAKIYLHPYDEIRASEDINNYESLIVQTKAKRPDIKYFVTLVKADAARLINQVDIAQLANEGEIKDQLPPAIETELWLYNNLATLRSSHPYSRDRLMAWKAFVNDFKGIGAWTYGGWHSTNSIDDYSINPNTERAMIYSDIDGSLISSRRWEGFKAGIEDYTILSEYAKIYGTAQTKILAQEVLDDEQNEDKADEIIKNMLIQLNQ